MAIFFANQKSSYKEDREDSDLWAPKFTNDGKSYPAYKVIQEVYSGDFILNSIGGSVGICSICVAKEDGYSHEEPEELKERHPGEWYREGWLVPVRYYDFSHPLLTTDLKYWLQANPREDSAFNKLGLPKQQYLCNLNSYQAAYILEKILRRENNSQVRSVVESALAELN